MDTDAGLEKLDSICMQLINIGEALKKIDKISDKELLYDYPEIDWKKVMGMRDIITHHYFDIDAEIVYTVCEERIPKLKKHTYKHQEGSLIVHSPFKCILIQKKILSNQSRE